MIRTQIVLNNQNIQFEGIQQNWEHPLGKFSLHKRPIESGYILSLDVKPSRSLQFQEVICTIPVALEESDQIFCNGFQSWSESRTFQQSEYIPNLKWFAKPFMKNYGDYHFKQIKRKKGFLHSWTYTYTTKKNQELFFVGSLSEKKAFTLFQWNIKKKELQIHIDVAERQIETPIEIFSLWIAEGEEHQLFDTWGQLQGISLPPQATVTGWTSWYNFYTDINEEKLLNALQQLQATFPSAHYFQIDDGYQKAVGDWWRIDTKKFPNGLVNLQKQIKDNDYQAGIWLAPFICEPKSDLYQNQSDWLLKDKKGKFVKAGYAPHWSGHFYAIDFYQEAFQEYLAKVLHFFTEEMGFKLLKLDFIYAVCLFPRKDKSRAEILVDAIQFIKTHAPKAKLLACGAPLGPLFGLVDYCRIGADIHLKWEHLLLKFFRNRERVSTAAALTSILARHHLNNRFFRNDPDVFILRSDNHQLTFQQQSTILKLATLSGNLVFNSDEMSKYSPESKILFEWFLRWKDSYIKSVRTIEKDFYHIEFEHEQQSFDAYANLTSQYKKLPKYSKIAPYETIVY
jgi:alpha-galactosidase